MFRSCTVKSCEQKHKSSGYCSKHYQRYKKHGDATKLLIRYERHGMTRSPTWYSWIAMIERATSDKYKQFKDYKGRGITIYPEWNVFSNFLRDMGKRPQGKTLDRIDNNGNYEPDNCRWATPHEQRINQRRMHV